MTAHSLLEVGGTMDERRANLKAVKITYDIRSDLVHNGSVKENESKRAQLEQCKHLCALLAQKVIESGTVPNWSDFDITDT